MIRLNQIGIETLRGYRSFELYEGSLAKLDRSVDVVAVSAFGGDYIPTPGTVIGSFRQELGIDVGKLARDCEYDLRQPLGIWISKPLHAQRFHRILCVELIGTEIDPAQALENVFVGIAVLEAKGVQVKRIALPVLGAGAQGINARLVMEALLPAAKRALEQSSCLENVLFVEINTDRVAELNEAMDAALGRSKIRLPKGPLIENLLADILTTLTDNHNLFPPGHLNLYQEMRRVLEQKSPRSFEVGILGRRLVEFVTDDLLAKKKTSPNLIEKIDKLGEVGVAPWIRGYMHTLRILGNDEAHEKNRQGRIPAFADEDDVVICLFATHRVFNFWQRNRRAQLGQSA